MSEEKLDTPVAPAIPAIVEQVSTASIDIDIDAEEQDRKKLPKQMTPKDFTGKLPDEIFNKWMKSVEEFERLWESSKDFDIQIPYLVEIGWDEPFLGSLSRRIVKTMTGHIPTAGVWINGTTLEMLWNPIFFKHELHNVSPLYPRGVIKHELYHIIFEHISSRKQTPHVLWNVATDLAINSLIPRKEMPAFTLMPGELYVPPQPPPDWKPSIIARIIKKLPAGQTSEWYMAKLLADPEVQQAMAKAKAAAKQKVKQKADGSAKMPGSPGSGQQPDDQQGDDGGGNDDGGGEGDFNGELKKELFGGQGGQFDDHDMWDKISDEQRDMMRDYIRDMFRDCVKEAERKQNGWGSVPDSIRMHLKKLLSKEVDWREILNQFIGRSRASSTTSSIKRVNRRVPWDFPGRKRSYRAKLAIAFDQSGSMADEWVELLFAELSNLGNLTEYEIIPFDYTVDEKNIQTIRRGGQPKLIRTRSGGTSFDAPVKYINENAHKYDAACILTDGGCSEPMKCNLPMAYILAPGQELMFKPKSEITIIKMTDTRKK